MGTSKLAKVTGYCARQRQSEPAATVAAVYKERWQIALFFRALKQSLRVKTFVGTSANALQTQLWTALIAMLLVKYLQLRSTFGRSLSNLVALLWQQLFVHRDLWTWIDDPFQSPPILAGLPKTVGAAVGLRRPIGLDSSDHPHGKKRVATRFRGEEFRQHRIRNKPSKPPTCSPSRG